MTHVFITAALSGLLVLAGCEDETATEADAARCGAADLSALVGQPESAATGISHDGATRIIPPGTAVTMEFNPDRLNIEIGEDGLISRVYCG